MHLVSKIFFVVAIASLASISLAQKVGFIASENILSRLPDARDAQGKLESQIDEWKTSITEMEIALKSKQNDYEKRRLILSPSERKRAEESVDSLKGAIVDFRTKKFGDGGELSVKQDELMKPVFEKIQKAISDVAQEAGYDYIFDKSSPGLYLLYTVPKYDLTSRVATKLGLSEKPDDKKKDVKSTLIKSEPVKTAPAMPSPARQNPKGLPQINFDPMPSPELERPN